MANVFRIIPDEVQVIEWLRTLNIHGWSDSHVFTETTFPWPAFESLLLQLEPYYFPCKARQYLYKEMTMNSAITVLRQLVRLFGYTFRTHERFAHGRKYSEYYLTMENLSTVIMPVSNIITFN
jgi:hypothetical protein